VTRPHESIIKLVLEILSLKMNLHETAFWIWFACQIPHNRRSEWVNRRMVNQPLLEGRVTANILSLERVGRRVKVSERDIFVVNCGEEPRRTSI